MGIGQLYLAGTENQEGSTRLRRGMTAIRAIVGTGSHVNSAIGDQREMTGRLQDLRCHEASLCGQKAHMLGMYRDRSKAVWETKGAA